MKTTRLMMPGILFGTAGILFITVALCAESSEGRSKHSKDSRPSVSGSKVSEEDRVPVAVARDRAKTMHAIYAATLDMMHHRYFHGDRAVVPARAMEDVFSEIELQSKAEARWISVNTKPMGIDHEPQSDFEKRAAAEIATGKTEIEVVEGGYYRHAGAIPLTGGCISCHGGFFKEPSKTPKFAGLVISVPVNSDSGKPE